MGSSLSKIPEIVLPAVLMTWKICLLIVFSSLNSKLEFICIEVEPTQKIFPKRRCSKAPNSSKKREKLIVVIVTREAEAQAIMQMDHGKMKK